MDRHLHRGKRLDNGNWARGGIVEYAHKDYAESRFLIFDYPNHHTSSLNLYWGVEIDPTTLGQCTGLSAKKSYRGIDPEDLLIFEGDIVNNEQGEKLRIIWLEDGAQWAADPYEYECGDYEWLHNTQKYEIIGNIHDNPELLEVAE